MGNIPSVATGQKATADQYNALQAGLNGVTENSYTSWSKILDVTITGTVGSMFTVLGIDNNGNFYGQDQSPYVFYINKSGGYIIAVQSQNSAGASAMAIIGAKSITGLYTVIYDASVPEVKIFSGGTLLSTIPTPSTSWDSTYSIAVAISPNGKYIALAGDASSNVIDRV